MPTGACEVTGDNDPDQRWVPIKARSAFEAVVFYYGTILAQMGPVGCPRPTPATIFQVRIDGQIYRVRGERALDWANRVAERRFQEAERQRRGR